MLKQFRMVLAVVTTFLCASATAEVSWLGGNINNTSATREGLLIMFDTGVPTNCTGTPYGWMLIPEANKTLISTALTMWITGKRGATVYTDPASSAGRFCVVGQLDPYD